MRSSSGGVAGASVGAFVFAFALCGASPARAQFGDLLNKARQAADSARSQLETHPKDPDLPAVPASSQDAPASARDTPPGMAASAGPACLTRYPMTNPEVRYQNNCGSDLVRLVHVEGTCTRTSWASGRNKSLVPYTREPVCRGAPQAGPGPCECGPGTAVAYADAPAPSPSPPAAPPAQTARDRVLQRSQDESGHPGGVNGAPGAVPACVKVQQLWDRGLNAVDPNSLYVENNCTYTLFTVRQQVEGTPYACKASTGRQPGSSFTVSKKDAATWVFCDGQSNAGGHNPCACSPDTHRFQLPRDTSGLPIAKSVR